MILLPPSTILFVNLDLLDKSMNAFWADFFNNDYMPHGHCYLWQPGILWSNVISDLVIATSYFSIAFALLIYSNKRKTQKFRHIIILFAIFILSCGITHIFAIYTIWNGSYGMQGILKAITAVASAMTMIVLLLNLDKIIAIPTPSELKDAEEEATRERLKRLKLEVEARSNSIFKFALELFPAGILVVDSKQKILLANNLVNEIFGYSKDELVDKPISHLVEKDNAASHEVLVSEYMKDPQSKEMQSGRLVWGLKKDGDSVPVDVTLSVHHVKNEKYTFASVTSVTDVGIQKKRFLETSRRLQRAVDATDVGIWEWNLLNDKVWFSPRLISLLSTNKEQHEITVDDWREHIHPDDTERVHELLNAHLAQKGDFEVTYRGKNKFGEYKWLRSKGDTVFDDNGKPILMSGTLTNIDTFHKLQLELEQKNAFLDGVLSQSNATVLIVNVNTLTLDYCNDRLAEMFGYNQQSLNSILNLKQVFKIVHPEDRQAFRLFFEAISNGTESKNTEIEVRIKGADIDYIWCILHAESHNVGEHDDVEQVLISIVDISDIKEREENIKNLAKDFLDTFEQAAVGISHIALDGKWIRVNQRLCDIIHYPKNELLSKKFVDICHPEDLEQVKLSFNSLLDGENKTFVDEQRFISKQANVVWVRITVSLVEDKGRDKRYFIAVVEDISKQKQLQIDLMRSNEELEQFAYVASHDLKEPIRTLRTYTSYLIKDLEANKADRVKEDKQFIDSAAKRMTNIIDDLLSFSRVGNATLKLVNIDLNEVIKQILHDLSVSIEEKNATVDCDYDLPFVHSDPVLLRLAIQNLIQNALKFIPENQIPKITINYTSSKTQVLLHVTDNGIGIDEQHQQQIFGIFKKLHSSDTYPGTGIGLAVVKKIVDRFKGSISLKSALGSGSTFTLHLPKEKNKKQ